MWVVRFLGSWLIKYSVFGSIRNARTENRSPRIRNRQYNELQIHRQLETSINVKIKIKHKILYFIVGSTLDFCSVPVHGIGSSDLRTEQKSKQNARFLMRD